MHGVSHRSDQVTKFIDPKEGHKHKGLYGQIGCAVTVCSNLCNGAVYYQLLIASCVPYSRGWQHSPAEVFGGWKQNPQHRNMRTLVMQGPQQRDMQTLVMQGQRMRENNSQVHCSDFVGIQPTGLSKSTWKNELDYDPWDARGFKKKGGYIIRIVWLPLGKQSGPHTCRAQDWFDHNSILRVFMKLGVLRVCCLLWPAAYTGKTQISTFKM